MSRTTPPNGHTANDAARLEARMVRIEQAQRRLFGLMRESAVLHRQMAERIEDALRECETSPEDDTPFLSANQPALADEQRTAPPSSDSAAAPASEDYPQDLEADEAARQCEQDARACAAAMEAFCRANAGSTSQLRSREEFAEFMSKECHSARVQLVHHDSNKGEPYEFTLESVGVAKDYWLVEVGTESFLLPAPLKSDQFHELIAFSAPAGKVLSPSDPFALTPARLKLTGAGTWRVREQGSIAPALRLPETQAERQRAPGMVGANETSPRNDTNAEAAAPKGTEQTLREDPSAKDKLTEEFLADVGTRFADFCKRGRLQGSDGAILGAFTESIQRAGRQMTVKSDDGGKYWRVTKGDLEAVLPAPSSDQGFHQSSLKIYEWPDGFIAPRVVTSVIPCLVSADGYCTPGQVRGGPGSDGTRGGKTSLANPRQESASQGAVRSAGTYSPTAFRASVEECFARCLSEPGAASSSDSFATKLADMVGSETTVAKVYDDDAKEWLGWESFTNKGFQDRPAWLVRHSHDTEVGVLVPVWDARKNRLIPCRAFLSSSASGGGKCPRVTAAAVARDNKGRWYVTLSGVVTGVADPGGWGRPKPSAGKQGSGDQNRVKPSAPVPPQHSDPQATAKQGFLGRILAKVVKKPDSDS